MDPNPWIPSVMLTEEHRHTDEQLRELLAARPVCPKCGGNVRDAKDGPYRACVACGHITDADPGYS